MPTGSLAFPAVVELNYISLSGLQFDVSDNYYWFKTNKKHSVSTRSCPVPQLAFFSAVAPAVLWLPCRHVPTSFRLPPVMPTWIILGRVNCVNFRRTLMFALKNWDVPKCSHTKFSWTTLSPLCRNLTVCHPQNSRWLRNMSKKCLKTTLLSHPPPHILHLSFWCLRKTTQNQDFFCRLQKNQYSDS